MKIEKNTNADNLHKMPKYKPARNLYKHSYGGDHLNTTGNKFSMRSNNKSVKSISVTYNMKYIEKIDATFYGDAANKTGGQVTRDTTAAVKAEGMEGESFARTFEFYPGEYLVGDIIISPTKNQTQDADEPGYYTENGMYYFTKAYEKSVAYIKFQTSYGRTFEAGYRNHMSYDVPHVFPADKSFLAGISGYSDLNANRVISLGFSLWTFATESFDDLRWVDQETDELEVISNDYGGETDLFCNQSARPKAHVFKYPVANGSYRCTWLDHPFLDAQTVQFQKKVVLPTIDSKGNKQYEPLIRYFSAPIDSQNYQNPKDDLLDNLKGSFREYTMNYNESANSEFKRIRYLSHTLPEDSTSIRINNAFQNLVIEPGKCAKLQFDYKISKYDNAKFIFNHNFYLDESSALSFEIEGYTSMEKQVSSSLEIKFTEVQYLDVQDTSNTNTNSRIKDYVHDKSYNIYDIFNEIQDQEEEDQRERRNSDADTIPRTNSDNDLFNLTNS